MENKNFELLVDAVAVLMGDYSPIRKKAADLIIRALVPHDEAKAIIAEAMSIPENYID